MDEQEMTASQDGNSFNHPISRRVRKGENALPAPSLNEPTLASPEGYRTEAKSPGVNERVRHGVSALVTVSRGETQVVCRLGIARFNSKVTDVVRAWRKSVHSSDNLKKVERIRPRRRRWAWRWR